MASTVHSVPGSAEKITALLSETFPMQSAEQGADFRVWVAHPLQSAPAQGHAVLFMFDARAYFAGVVEITRLMSISLEIPPLIIVGLGYDAADYGAQVERRTFDLSLSEQSSFSHAGYRTGGAPQLLRFIERELKPLIAGRYKADIERSWLMGHSLGGLVTLYEALERPEQFRGYIVSSPAIASDRATVEGALKTSAQLTRPFRMYVSAGELEGAQTGQIADGVRELETRLSAPAYSHIDRLTRILPHETHATAIYAALPQSLRWMLRDEPVDTGFDISAFAATTAAEGPGSAPD